MDDQGSMQREHKVSAALTSDPFDRELSTKIGLPNGAHTQPTVVQHISFYGDSTQYIVQSVKTDEGVTTFVTQVDALGSKRYILPTNVLATIGRQRDSLTTKIRRRHGKRIAEERAARGEQPGFMKGKKKK